MCVSVCEGVWLTFCVFANQQVFDMREADWGWIRPDVHTVDVVDSGALIMISGLLAARGSLKWTTCHWKSTLHRICLPKPSRQWLLGTVFHRWTTAPSRVKQKPVFARAPAFGDKLAVIDSSGSYSYKQLYASSVGLALQITSTLNSDLRGLEGKRVSFMCCNDASYTVAQWATWMSGGTAVPLYRKHPPSELEYIISDSQSELLLAGHPHAQTLEAVAQKLGLPCLTLPPTSELCTLNKDEKQQMEESDTEWAERPAMIIYTSGTTGRPKGVLHTHSNIQAMVNELF